MKNLGKTAIVCAIIFFVFVIAGGICFGLGIANSAVGENVISNISSYIDSANDTLYIDSDSFDMSVSEDYTISEKIKELEFNNVCGDITVIAVSDTDVITVDYNGPSGLLNNNEITFKEDGDTLKVVFGKNIGSTINFSGISFGNQFGKFTIYIPQSFSGAMEISNAAGAVEASELTLHALEIENAAGEINLFDMTIGELSLNNTVGEVNVSGKIGAVDISDNIGECHIDCSAPFTGNCEIENALGEINIYLPSNARINLETSNALGEISVDDSLRSSTGVNFEVSSCLGEIKIIEK